MAEAPQQVVALLGGDLLAELGAATGEPQPTLIGPTDQAPTQAERLPRSAGGWKIRIGRAVAPALGDRLHPATHSHPHRRGGAH